VALVAVEIPKVGLVMETARLVRWLKSVGDTVATGEPLLEVETEKSVIEIESSVSGRLVEVLMQPDREAKVGDRIAWIETGDPPPARASAGASPSAAAGDAPRSAGARGSRAGDRIRSTPVARRLASEQGVDIGRIVGSGPRGRVQLEDVEQAIATRARERAPALAPAVPAMPPMRRALARAMTLSNATIPQFTVERTVEVTTLQALRAELSAALAHGSPRLSMNDFLLQAVARTLLELPSLNAIFSGDPESPDARIVRSRGAHIGLVLAVEDGLLVPVFHDVERAGLAEIARRRVDLVERGLSGRLKREELDGATLSISNLGAHGPDRFTAIINPPQAAILAVGRQRNAVVARNGGIEVRPVCALTLTVDHRLADGRLASAFLARLVELLEGRGWRLECRES
jgi:pyruvate dehydrogenase E2 component (dihydrolipoamide acetyltransferase)